MSKIEFRGAVNTVTGSKFIISNNDTKVMLDCGMYQGAKDDSYLRNKDFADDIPYVDHCILSHSHIDHSGMLPALTKSGFAGKIYATPATKDLCIHMLRDSVSVFTKELPIISKILRKKKNQTQVLPIYDVDDVERCIGRFKSIDYNKVLKLNNSMSFSFHDSCHILGSASIKVNVKEHGVEHSVWYTSDIGHDKTLLCNEPKIPQGIDNLVIETTYGNKKRKEENVNQKVMEYINDAAKRGGKIIIPAFSVGRMQTMLLIAHKLHVLGLIPDIPIYVDSPLGVKVTHLYEKYEDQINQDTIKFFRDQGLNPFDGPMIHYVSSAEETQEIANDRQRGIVISASGMCEGGLIREYIKANIADKNSTILFVGYNAIGTLGRRIQESNGQVTIDALPYRMYCKVETLGGLSAHADLDYLIRYVEQCMSVNAIKNIFLVHGDPDSVLNVQKVLKNKGITNTVIPEINKQYDL